MRQFQHRNINIIAVLSIIIIIDIVTNIIIIIHHHHVNAGIISLEEVGPWGTEGGDGGQPRQEPRPPHGDLLEEGESLSVPRIRGKMFTERV